MSPADRGIFVGAYAASPTLFHWDAALEEAYLAGIDGIAGVRGLELPWIGGLHRHDPDWLLRSLPARLDLIVTGVPCAVGSLAKDPDYGFASRAEHGRQAALEDAARLRDDIHRLTDAAGRASVVAVELHSAPRADRGSAEALSRSLAEIEEWDWGGAELVVEHCDALVDGREPQKGFLALDDEIGALSSTGVGLSLNWGRSAIELRDPDSLPAHIARARESGRLRGLIFSGAAAEPGAFGAPWQDTHLPFARSSDFGWGDPHSLLTLDRARAALLSAGDLAWLGFKFGWMREDSSVADRIEMIDSATRLLLDLPSRAT